MCTIRLNRSERTLAHLSWQGSVWSALTSSSYYQLGLFSLRIRSQNLIKQYFFLISKSFVLLWRPYCFESAGVNTDLDFSDFWEINTSSEYDVFHIFFQRSNHFCKNEQMGWLWAKELLVAKSSKSFLQDADYIGIEIYQSASYLF